MVTTISINYILRREHLADKYAEGALLLNGETGPKFCDTVEDKVREVKGPDGKWIWKPEFKVAKETAIPSGCYRLDMTMSTRFQMIMPIVIDVPDFTGIRIHGGNDEQDTEGCPLLGLRSLGGHLVASKAWSTLFRGRLTADLKRGKVYLVVKNP